MQLVTKHTRTSRIEGLSVIASVLAAIFAASARLAHASTIFGGPTYDTVTSSGYRDPILSALPGSTAGNGVAVGIATKFNAGNYDGLRAFLWDASGTPAAELNNLSTGSGTETASAAYAVNSAGVAVGWGYGNERAVRWDSSGIVTELGHLGVDFSGLTICSAFAVNESGTAVGVARKYSGGANLGDRATRWDASGTAATELGNLGTANSVPGFTKSLAYAVNDSGTTVGYAQKYMAGAFLGTRAVRWDAAGIATGLGDIGTRSDGFTNGDAYEVNAAGTAVGRMTKYAGDATIGFRAVRWEASNVAAVELAALGTDSNGFTMTTARAINVSGTTIGGGRKYVDGAYVGSRAIRWDASGTLATELGNLGTDASGVTRSDATAINAAGLIVGSADKYTGAALVGTRPVIWGTDSIAIDLNTLLAPTDAVHWTLTSVADISDTNWITGVGVYDPDSAGPLVGYNRMYMMQIPEPVLMAPLTVGAACLFFRWRRCLIVRVAECAETA